MTQFSPCHITYGYEVETFSPPRVRRGYGGSGRIHSTASPLGFPLALPKLDALYCIVAPEFPQVIGSEQRAPGGRLAFYDFLLFESTRTLISTIGRAYATEIYVYLYRHMRIVCDLYPAEY